MDLRDYCIFALTFSLALSIFVIFQERSAYDSAIAEQTKTKMSLADWCDTTIQEAQDKSVEYLNEMFSLNESLMECSSERDGCYADRDLQIGMLQNSSADLSMCEANTAMCEENISYLEGQNFTRILQNFAYNYHYNFVTYNCWNYSKNLVDLLISEGYNATMVFGRGDSCPHWWVRATIDIEPQTAQILKQNTYVENGC